MDVSLMRHIVYVYLQPLIASSGIIGNILMFLTILMGRLTDPPYIYLTWMACVDILVLAIILFMAFPRCGTCKFTTPQNLFFKRYEYFFYFPIGNACAMFLIFTTTAMTLERLMYVRNPLKAPLICTRKKAHKICAGLLILAIVLQFPRFFLYNVSAVAREVNIPALPQFVNLKCPDSQLVYGNRRLLLCQLNSLLVDTPNFWSADFDTVPINQSSANLQTQIESKLEDHNKTFPLKDMYFPDSSYWTDDKLYNSFIHDHSHDSTSPGAPINFIRIYDIHKDVIKDNSVQKYHIRFFLPELENQNVFRGLLLSKDNTTGNLTNFWNIAFYQSILKNESNFLPSESCVPNEKMFYIFVSIACCNASADLRRIVEARSFRLNVTEVSIEERNGLWFFFEYRYFIAIDILLVLCDICLIVVNVVIILTVRRANIRTKREMNIRSEGPLSHRDREERHLTLTLLCVSFVKIFSQAVYVPTIPYVAIFVHGHNFKNTDSFNINVIFSNMGILLELSLYFYLFAFINKRFKEKFFYLVRYRISCKKITGATIKQTLTRNNTSSMILVNSTR